jgi:hypothetical protein
VNGGGLLVSHLHSQPSATRGDAEGLIAQLPRKVEGLSHGLLQREASRVLTHRCFERGADLRRRAEVPVGRYQSPDALMRAPVVVAVDEERQPPDAVVEVCEDGAAQEFVPQRLPEALCLPQRLWVVWAALEVVDVLSAQLGLEFRLPSPRCVLTPVVRQYFERRSEGGDAALERLEHELRALPVRYRVAHHEAAVVVHEDGHIEPLMPPQAEGEDVRLPHLVRLGSLEPSLGPRCLRLLRRSRLEQSLLMENSAHRRRRHSEPLEALEHVRDAAGAELGALTLHPHHGGAPRVFVARRALRRTTLVRNHRVLATALQRIEPVVDRRVPDAVDAGDLVHRRSLPNDFLQHPQPELCRVARHPSRLLLPLPSHPSLPSRLRVRLRRATVLSN